MNVYAATADTQKVSTSVPLPFVFNSAVRADVVRFVHNNMIKNTRQAHSVYKHAGEQTSAESWGTGRAVARIPRVGGGGTHRSGQGAFGNMCRGGRMFAPTKVWRRWHRKINVNQRRFAVVSSLAASAVAGLVSARGHKIDEVPEVPLVVSNEAEAFHHTKEAKKLLEVLKCDADVQKVKDTKHIRAGKGKMRNRRYVLRKGPLVVYAQDSGIVRAFVNIPGVELCHVDRLSVLRLAPGGQVGRFIVWTQNAFQRLNELFGTLTEDSKLKSGYKLPRSVMALPDLKKILTAPEIQNAIRPRQRQVKRSGPKSNPLRNAKAMLELNPYAATMRESEKKLLEQRKVDRAAALKKARESKPNSSKTAAAKQLNKIANA